jgi:putative ABC transport system permease protein
MKYLPYMLKHLRRNWIRTSTTIFGIAVCVFLFCVLRSVLAAVDYGMQSGNANRLITRHAVGLTQQVPVTYQERIRAVPDVTRVAIANWFNGFLGMPPDYRNFFANFAIDPAAEYLDMHPEFVVPAEERAAFIADRRGALVGKDLADKHGWKIGSTVQLESTIPPYRIGKPFDFVVRAIYTADKVKNPGTDLTMFFFHFKYLYEATGQRVGVGTYSLQIEDSTKAPAVAKAVDALFENSEAQTKTETEAQFIASFFALAGNLALLLNLIGTAVAFTILLVTANTMSMAVRERRKEIAVLKTLGFSSGLVMMLILGEALLIGLLGGGLGLLLGGAMIGALPHVPMIGDLVRGFPNFGMTWAVASLGLGFALSLSFAAGLIPAANAFRARITDMLRTV